MSKVEVEYEEPKHPPSTFGDIRPGTFFRFAPSSGRTPGGLRLRLAGLGYTLIDQGASPSTAEVGDNLIAGRHSEVVPLDVKIIACPQTRTA